VATSRFRGDFAVYWDAKSPKFDEVAKVRQAPDACSALRWANSSAMAACRDVFANFAKITSGSALACVKGH